MYWYLSNNVFKFTASTKLTADSGFGINGFISKVKMIKSRTNRAGQEVSLVYDQKYGFDRILSNYQFIKDAGFVHSGAWSYLEGLPSVKFQMKNFKEKLYDNDLLKEAFRELVMEAGEQYLSGGRDDETVSVNNEEQLSNLFMSSLEEADFSDIA